MSEGTTTTTTSTTNNQQQQQQPQQQQQQQQQPGLDENIRAQVTSIVNNNELTGQEQLSIIRTITTDVRYIPTNLLVLLASASQQAAPQQQQQQQQQLVPIVIGSLPEMKTKEFGYNYPFMSRTKFYEQMNEILWNNYIFRGSPNTQSHTFTFIAGGSGIGKTRAGFEISEMGPQLKPLQDDPNFTVSMENAVYLYINCGNGSKYYKDLDKMDEDIRIGIRVALASGIYKYKRGDQVEYDTISKFVESGNMKQFVISKVIDDIRRKHLEKNYPNHHELAPPTAIIIHIDEYQFYIDKYMAAFKEATLTELTFKEARDFFKLMLKSIGSVMTARKDVFIIPVCTGTSDRDLSFLKTEYKRVSINLNPLSREDCDRIIQYHVDYSNEKVNGTKVMAIKDNDQNGFEICLRDTGFVPKYITYFMEQCTIDKDKYGTLTYQFIKSILHPENLTVQERRNLCLLAFSQTPVQLETRLSDRYTVDSIRREGIIYLSQALNIIMPFYDLKAFCLHVSEPSLFPDKLLIFPGSHDEWLWQNFEELYIYYQVCLINSFGIGKKTFTCQDVFRGAFGARFLSNETITHYPTNVGFEHNSVFPSFNVTDGDSKKTDDIRNSNIAWMCSKNTPTIDHRFMLKTSTEDIYVNVQSKLSCIEVDDRITNQKVLQMAKTFFKKINTLVLNQNTIVVYLLVTNRYVDSRIASYFHELPSRNPNHYLLVISRGNLKLFFTSTFAHRVLIPIQTLVAVEESEDEIEEVNITDDYQSDPVPRGRN